MEARAYETSYFKNIFPDYTTFSNWYKGIPLSDNATDVPSEKTFILIYYEYADSHVAFSDEAFREHFAIDLYTYYKEFEQTSAAIDVMMSLTANDISTDGSVITNIANIPETTLTTDAEEVDFVGQQQKMINKKGSLRISKELIGAKRAYTVKTFIKKFAHLFMNVYSPYYTYVYQDNLEDN